MDEESTLRLLCAAPLLEREDVYEIRDRIVELVNELTPYLYDHNFEIDTKKVIEDIENKIKILKEGLT